MYLLYLDESGNPADASDRHFVLAGLAVFERRTYWMQQAAEIIKATNFPTAPPLDFHTQPIRNGKGFWRHITPERRAEVLAQIGNVMARAPQAECVLFGAVVEKTDQVHGDEAIRLALEQVCKRFDTLLKRKARRGNPQRGLIVLAQSHYEQRAKAWVSQFRGLGTQWGVLTNLSDIPFSAPAKESRMLQLADYVAHALYLLFERRDATLIKAIIGRFDATGGVYHGMVHLSANRGHDCGCPACASRHTAGSTGSWL